MASQRVNFVRVATVLATLWLVSTPAQAHHRDWHGGGGEEECAENCGLDPIVATEDYDWMHADVGVAHIAFTGAGTFISVVDDFTSGNTIIGRLEYFGDDGNSGAPFITNKMHGEWTYLMASLVAPGATVLDYGFNVEKPVELHDGSFDVINLSYGLIARAAFAGAFSDWSLLGQPHESVLYAAYDYSADGGAFISKAAGNDNGAAVGETVKGKVDVLALELIGSFNTIFVGALEWNPDGTGQQEAIASYSTIAGIDPIVQAQFLVVGVEGGRTDTDAFASYGSKCGDVPNGTCLYGTSFAAPIVAGYAAIVAGKFRSLVDEVFVYPTPSQVANQLLSTARTNTILGYDVAVHGKGEASLYLALSPAEIK